MGFEANTSVILSAFVKKLRLQKIRANLEDFGQGRADDKGYRYTPRQSTAFTLALDKLTQLDKTTREQSGKEALNYFITLPTHQVNR